jgi:peptide/nickel transport system ATP-binding protein
VPLIDPEGEQQEIRLEGEIPGASEEIAGCPFHTRCPRILGDVCREEVPPWREDEETGKRYFCHIPRQDLLDDQKRTFRFRES